MVGIRPGHSGRGDLACRKLASLGIVAGSAIRLIQKRPLPVIALGNSKFAIDMNTADLVMCVPDGGSTAQCAVLPD
ncbi:MAG: ferrous iron transport protein A [Firmicutes bacterium]|nr:ferrous iron transport protein A [Bacillota bacterium]